MEYIIKGRVDLLKDGEIIEIKTSRAGFKIPYEHHIEQLQIYMNLLKANEGRLLYITPDRIVEFKFVRRKIDMKQVLNDYFKSDGPRYEWECKYCPFSQFCNNTKVQHLP